jgi:hypothetical protein
MQRYKCLLEKAGTQVYLKILINFPLRIRIQILESQINADPDPQHCKILKFQRIRHKEKQTLHGKLRKLTPISR